MNLYLPPNAINISLQDNQIMLMGKQTQYPLAFKLDEVMAMVQHCPITPKEIEMLIIQIENTLEKQKDRIVNKETNVLTSSITQFYDIAQIGFADLRQNGIWLSIKQTERLYQRLVKVANGYPAKSEGLPDKVEFAFYLILLREIMHHWQFDELYLPLHA